MKRVLFILSVALLLWSGTLFSLVEYYNPAEITEEHYPFYELYLANHSENLTTLSKEDWAFGAAIYKPHRAKWSTYQQLNYSHKDYASSYKILKGRRINANYSVANAIGIRYGIENRQFEVSIEPGFVYRYNGNWHFGLSNRLELKSEEWSDLRLNNELSGLIHLKLNPLSKIVFRVNTFPKAEVIYQHKQGRIGVELGLGVAFDESKTAYLGRLGLAYSFKSKELGLSTLKEEGYSRKLYLSEQYGDYTPPLVFSETLFPFKKEYQGRYGLALEPVVEQMPDADYRLTVKRGDNLTRISRQLPIEVEDRFHNNPLLIAQYNKLSSPSLISPGQVLNLPVKMTQKPTEVFISTEIKQSIQQALSILEMTDLIEAKVNQSLWTYKLYGAKSFAESMPIKADIGNLSLLNTQALIEINERNPKVAIRKLRFALSVDDQSAITHTNIGVAYYLNNNRKEAKYHLQKGVELNKEYGLNLDLTLSNKILQRLK
ncbi:MAG: LysM peptidoglycan-binding domain-containing protein [Candidatus Cloacimonadia bacterium]